MIAFDFDGVLVDTAELARASYMAVRADMGLDVLPELSSTADLPLIYHGQLSKSLTRWIPYETAEEFWSQHATACRSSDQAEIIFPDLVPELSRLSGVGGYAIVTGAHGETVRRTLQRSSCEEPKVLLDRRESGTKQDKLAWLKELMDATHYVGDTGSDMLHARAAGLIGVAVSYGYGSLADPALAAAGVVLSTPAELAGWVRENAGVNEGGPYGND